MILFFLIILLLGKNVLRDRREFISPRTFFLLGYLVVLGRGALLASLYGYEGNENAFEDVMLWSTVGLLAFELGTWSRQPPKLISSLFRNHYQFDLTRMLYVVVIYVITGVLAVTYLAYGYKVGIVDYLISLRSIQVEEGAGPVGERYMGWVVNVGIAAGSLAFGILVWDRWSRSRQFILFGVVGLAAVLTVHGGGRFAVFQYACALVLLWYLSKTAAGHPRLRKFVGVGVLAGLTLFSMSVIGEYRGYGLQDVDLQEATPRPGKLLDDTNILTSTVDTFEFFPQRHAYLYGSTFAILPVTFVPRAWWPDKPEALGIIIVKLRNLDGLPYSEAVSTIGELYANFGVLGIPFGMLFYGLICRWLFLLYSRNQQNFQFVILYILSLPFFAMHVRGEFVTVWAHYFSFALPLYIGMRCCRRVAGKYDLRLFRPYPPQHVRTFSQ